MCDKPNIIAAKGFFVAQRCGDLDDVFCDGKIISGQFFVYFPSRRELVPVMTWS